MRQILLVLGATAFAACSTEPEPPPPPLAGKIVFLSDRAQPDSGRELYAMNPDGSDIRRVPIPATVCCSGADIGPDGNSLAFVRQGIYTVRADGTDLQHPLPSLSYAPDWSPDGAYLAYHAYSEEDSDIWIMDRLGNRTINLTQSPSSAEFDPDWSPDGAKIVYERGPVDFGTPLQLWKSSRDGTGAEQVTTDPEHWATSPEFSPDGRWIAYAWGGDIGLSTDIRLIRPDGTEDRSIFHAPGGRWVDSPSWAPDGNSLVFSCELGIATIRADGSDFRVVVDSGFNAAPDWGPAPPP